MKIRSVTQFLPLTWPFDEGWIASASRLLTDARLRFTDTGFEVQSVCLATPPFLDVLGYPDTPLLLEFAQRLDDLARKHRIDSVSIGPVVATTPLALLMSIHALPQVIEQTEKISSGVLFADAYGGINLSAAHAFAQTVYKVAHATPSGIGNLRLTAMANVPPHVPYVAAAYQQGGAACFTIATEAADLALTAIGSSRSLSKAHTQLVESIESAGAHILTIADNLVDEHQVEFKGLDFSLAPFAQEGRSIGAAVEKLGVDAFGGGGTLFAMSFLANAVRQANIPHVGFSGAMLPVLGDRVIARRAEEGRFSVNDLLLYSATCNAGLDLIPIPGNTSTEEIAAIFLDMAALAITMDRPLASRLLPIPNKAVGQKVTIKAANLVGSRILPVKNLGAEQLFRRNSFLNLKAPGDKPDSHAAKSTSSSKR